MEANGIVPLWDNIGKNYIMRWHYTQVGWNCFIYYKTTMGTKDTLYLFPMRDYCAVLQNIHFSHLLRATTNAISELWMSEHNNKVWAAANKTV